MDEQPIPSTSTAPAPISTAPPPLPIPAPLIPRTHIREGDNVLLKLPNQTKPVKIGKGNINLGKFGIFEASQLVGKPYGHTYEIKDGKLHILHTTLREIEETEANNENINYTGAQKLTFLDIEALKKEGLSGRDIIQKQIEEHAAFELKTEYSKEKYLKRKEAKYLQIFTPLEPTVHTIAQFNFEKQPSKTRELRPDTLSLMLNMANVRPGGRLLIVEDLHGMVVAGAVERMGGEGRIMLINDFDSPPDVHLLESFNFPPSMTDDVISTINWAMTDERYTPPDLPMEVPDDTPRNRNSREVMKMKKRKATYEKNKEAREDYFEGEFDAVLLAAEYDPWSMLERLLPVIAGSAPIVIFSPYLSLLHDTYRLLKSSASFLGPSLTEPFLRQYQVLPGRTHPTMQGMAHGGYLLSCTRVYGNEDANSVTAGRREDLRKRRGAKRERELMEAQKSATGPETEGESGTEGETSVEDKDGERHNKIAKLE